MKLPKYNDDKPLAKFIGKIRNDANDEADWVHANREWDTVPPVRLTVTDASLERHAVENENFHQLATLWEKGFKLSAKAMMVAKLRGEFKSDKRGRPRHTDQQWEKKPAYWANKEVKPIARLLKHYYPKEKSHTERAVELAADLAEIDRVTLEKYRKP